MSDAFILLSVLGFLGSLFLIPLLSLPSMAVAAPIHFIGRSWARRNGRRFPGYYFIYITGTVMVLALTVLFIAGVWDTASRYDGTALAAVWFSILAVVFFSISMYLLLLSLGRARVGEQRDGRTTWFACAGLLACTFSVAVALSSVQWVVGFYHYEAIGPLIQGPPGPNWLELLIGPD